MLEGHKTTQAKESTGEEVKGRLWANVCTACSFPPTVSNICGASNRTGWAAYLGMPVLISTCHTHQTTHIHAPSAVSPPLPLAPLSWPSSLRWAYLGDEFHLGDELRDLADLAR